MLRIQIIEELLLKSGNILYRHIQQESLGYCVDDDDLILYRHGLVLRLLQHFFDPFALCQLLLGIRIQFGSELDADTKEKLAQGERIKEVLKQPQYQPMPVQYQVIIIYAVTKRFLLDVPVEDITRFEKEFFDYLDTKHPEIPAAIAEEKVISDATEEKLVKALNDFKAEFLK